MEELKAKSREFAEKKVRYINETEFMVKMTKAKTFLEGLINQIESLEAEIAKVKNECKESEQKLEELNKNYTIANEKYKKFTTHMKERLLTRKALTGENRELEEKRKVEVQNDWVALYRLVEQYLENLIRQHFESMYAEIQHLLNLGKDEDQIYEFINRGNIEILFQTETKFLCRIILENQFSCLPNLEIYISMIEEKTDEEITEYIRQNPKEYLGKVCLSYHKVLEWIMENTNSILESHSLESLQRVKNLLNALQNE